MLYLLVLSVMVADLLSILLTIDRPVIEPDHGYRVT